MTLSTPSHDVTELIGYVGLLADTAVPSRPLIEALLDAERQRGADHRRPSISCQAIARQLGPADARVVGGAELTVLDEEAHANSPPTCRVFAQVSGTKVPDWRLQHCGRVTAMVGDGANDAAAIRMADVGIG